MILIEKVLAYVRGYGKVSAALLFSIILLLDCVTIIFSKPRDLIISFLDVGQGDAILVQTPSGHTMLIDGGPNNAVLYPLSRSLPFFTHAIDVMVATHPDSDHVTGLIPVLESYDVSTIIISPNNGSTELYNTFKQDVLREKANVHVAKTDDMIDFHDGVTAVLLYPPPLYVPTHDTNDASVSMLIRYGDDTFLLTGDLPSTEEPKLIQSGFLSRHVTVYKAGHHGSKTSSGIPLLSYINPEYAVISAGKNNKYGHPNPETIKRLEMYAKEIISTIDKGTISFLTDGKNIVVQTTK